MSHTHNIEVMFDFTRNDLKACTAGDLRIIAQAFDLSTYWLDGKEFNDSIETIQEDEPTLCCGLVNCHALITITTDDADEDATAERVAEAICPPEIEGYTANLNGVVPVYL
jgi:hypothetical protein